VSIDEFEFNPTQRTVERHITKSRRHYPQTRWQAYPAALIRVHYQASGRKPAANLGLNAVAVPLLKLYRRLPLSGREYVKKTPALTRLSNLSTRPLHNYCTTQIHRQKSFRDPHVLLPILRSLEDFFVDFEPVVTTRRDLSNTALHFVHESTLCCTHMRGDGQSCIRSLR
jgi:hypothetical protein